MSGPYIKTYELSGNKQICIIPDMPHSHKTAGHPSRFGLFFDGALNGNRGRSSKSWPLH
jgi:hypothetical protein